MKITIEGKKEEVAYFFQSVLDNKRLAKLQEVHEALRRVKFYRPVTSYSEVLETHAEVRNAASDDTRQAGQGSDVG